MPYLARFENKATSHPPIPSREKFLKIRNGFIKKKHTHTQRKKKCIQMKGQIQIRVVIFFFFLFF